MEELNNVAPKLLNQELDYVKLFKILISRWYWILSSVLLCLIIANLYLWYTPKTYITSGTLRLEDKKSELPDLAGAVSSNERSNTSRVQSETIVLQSNSLLLDAIKQLDYRISYFVIGRVLNRTNELYPQKPINIELLKFDSLNFYHGLVVYKAMNNIKFHLKYSYLGKVIEKDYIYDEPFMIGATGFKIRYSGISKNSVYLFKLNVADDFLGRVRGGLRIGETGKNSNIISLQQTDSNPYFASDILNAVMNEYLKFDRIQKMQSATQMISFIDDQLKYLSSKVNTSTKSIANYKQNLKIVDVSTAAQAATAKSTGIETQITTLKGQLLAVDQLKADVIKEKNNSGINFNMEGVVDPQLQAAITKLDNLISSKNSLLKIYNADAPNISDINKQILLIKSSAVDDIELLRTLLIKNLEYLNGQLGTVTSQISQFPTAQNNIAELERDFNINDKVYSLLSEKKLNAQISRAGILPGASIIDSSQPNLTPVAPDENGIKKTAFIASLLIGIGAIILIRIINPFIYDKETIESLTTIPIIGVIRKYDEEIDEYSSQILSIAKPKSIFAESVRSVRTNLSFLASEKTNKIICVTSDIAGEGKSFVAVNLASTLALIEKKVLLIASDLRRSKIHKTFNVPNDVGLSSYLANQCELSDIIKHSNENLLDFIVSGPVPPNPSELLHSEKMQTLIGQVRNMYDIVMIDTAPIGLVSDSTPLIRMSDINLFVIRSGRSKFYSATIPQRMAQEYNLENTVIVLNAYSLDLLHSRFYSTKFTGDNYGSKYYYYSDYTGYEASGYYIDKKKKSWWDLKSWFN